MKFIETLLQTIVAENERWPNRHREVHKGCCKHCPSNNDIKSGTVDSESEEIKTYPKEVIIKEFLFVCAWRPNKLCKGNCDAMNVSQQDINSFYESETN